MPYTKGMAVRQITCSVCGKVVDLNFYGQFNPIVKQMREAQLCFDCIFWENYCLHPFPDTYIINGALFEFHPITNRRSIKFNMRKPEIRFVHELESGLAFASVDYQYIKTVPPHFRDKLHDQMKFISKDNYEIMEDCGCMHCMRKGCYDRYECYWYIPAIAEPDGPWNKIPKNHTTGEEMCVSFINKSKMYDCT